MDSPSAHRLAFSCCQIRRFRAFLLGATALSILLTATSSRAEDEEADPPPDALVEPESSTFSESGILGGGSVPPSLLTPDRLQIGNFSLSGQAAFATVYDDNVEANDDERDEDVFLTFSPSVSAQSLYARHSLGFNAGATAGTALNDSTDDFLDWRISADTRLDLSRRKRIDAAVGYSLEVEDDEDVDAEDGDDDVPVQNLDAAIGYSADGDRLGYSIGTRIERVDFTEDDFDDRDNTAVNIDATLRLRWSERLSFSAGPSYRHISFDEDVADDGEDRDANQYGFRIGAGYRLGRAIRAQASLGYSQLNFDDSDREDRDSATASAGLAWSPGYGATLNLGVSRSLGISIIDGEDSTVRTTGSATLSHRLPIGSRSELTSSLGLSVSRLSDFDRTDLNLLAGVTYGYRLTDFAFFTSSYRFSQRTSDDDDTEFYRNLISLGVTLRY